MNTTLSQNPTHFFSGGGEMGELIRNKDWSNTALGCPEQWPQSLRTMLNVILHSQFTMFIWWGPELICFYNDAYRPSLGINGKHPSILGMPAQEAWAEIWPVIKPLIDQVLAGGEATWSENQLIPIYRNNRLEDVYWTFSYSPIHDDSGAIAGVLVICQETTRFMRTVQMLECSEERFRNIVQQAPLGIAILKGPDFVIEMANQAYLDIVDRRGTEHIGKKLFDVLPEVEEAVSPLLTKVRETGNPFYGVEFPVDIIRHGRREASYFNFVYHPLKEPDGAVYAIMVVASEVTSSVRAKQAVAESEKQFRNMIMQSPIPMTIFRGKDHVIEMANTIMFERIWRKKESEVIGRRVVDVFPELKGQKYPELLDKVYNSAQPYRESESVALVKGNDGIKKFYLDFEYAPLFDPGGAVSGIMVTVNDVTEKVLARKKAEDSELRFRNIADRVPVLIWMAGTDRHFSFFNTAWLNFTGRTMKEELDNRWIEGIHPEDRERYRDTYRASFDKREEFHIDYRLRRYDGLYRWVSDHGVPRFTNDGVFEGYIGACMDIHDELLSQTALRENEERLNIAIEAGELGTWELDMATDTIICSERYTDIFGYPKGIPLTYTQISRQIFPDDLAQRNEAFREGLKHGMIHYEVRIISQDNTVKWIEKRGKVFYDETGGPKKLIGTLRDISAEKNYQEKLREREKKFRLLADAMPQMIWTCDKYGNLDYFNRSLYGYAGLNDDELREKGWLQIVHPDEREADRQQWEAALKSGQDFITEHRFRRSDGAYRWQLTRAVPQKDAAGNIEMWVGASTDIDEIKELDQQKDYFISVASHELKTPVTSIKGYVQLLQDKYESAGDAFLKSALSIIHRQVDRLTLLISDLLDLSKIKSGSLSFSEQQFYINHLVEETIEQISQIYPSHKISFIKGENVPVSADRERIEQVLVNLLTNAVKYSPGADKIKVETVLDKGWAVVSIEDYGVGISRKNQERIFERFYRVEGKSEKTFPGFGIGLFIASEIIRRHNGKIGVMSEPGKGSVFYFSLPVYNINI